jgi:hypothetical protein
LHKHSCTAVELFALLAQSLHNGKKNAGMPSFAYAKARLMCLRFSGHVWWWDIDAAFFSLSHVQFN